MSRTSRKRLTLNRNPRLIDSNFDLDMSSRNMSLVSNPNASEADMTGRNFPELIRNVTKEDITSFARHSYSFDKAIQSNRLMLQTQ